MVLLSGSFRVAIVTLQPLIQQPPVHTYIQSLVRLLEIMIHFDLGNHDLLNDKLRNTKRYLIRHNKLFKFEYLMLTYINRIVNASDREKTDHLFRQLIEKMEIELRNRHEELVVLQYFKIMDWLKLKRSKLI